MHPFTVAWLGLTADAVMDSLDWGPDNGPPRGIDLGLNDNGASKVRRLFDPTQWAAVTWSDTMDTMQLPGAIPAEGFDVVLCCDVLHRVKAWPSLILHAARLLAPSGYLVIMCPIITPAELATALGHVVGPDKARWLYLGCDEDVPKMTLGHLMAAPPRHQLAGPALGLTAALGLDTAKVDQVAAMVNTIANSEE
jgi:hypothetical protein